MPTASFTIPASPSGPNKTNPNPLPGAVYFSAKDQYGRQIPINKELSQRIQLPPGGNARMYITTQSKVIPAYLYHQFSAFSEIEVFFNAYNQLAQKELSQAIRMIPFDYTQTIISTAELNYIARFFWGVDRGNAFYSTVDNVSGAIDEQAIDDGEIVDGKASTKSIAKSFDDDYFRRIITWNCYRGDGTVLTHEFFKRRIARFLNCPNGTDVLQLNTASISLYIKGDTVTCKAPASDPNAVAQLNRAFQIGAVQLPFGYTFTITSQ